MSRGMNEDEVAIARAGFRTNQLDSSAHEFLKKIELFVGAAGRDETGNGVGSMLALDVGKPINHMVHGFEPGGFDELIAFAKKRLFQACGAIDVLEPKAPSHTEPTMPLGRVGPVAPFVLPGQW